jgi:hypothetical protein
MYIWGQVEVAPSFDTSGFYLGLKIDEFSGKYLAAISKISSKPS